MAGGRQSIREMVTGESHYGWGTRHRLKVLERPGRANIEVDGDRLLLYVPEGTTSDERREVHDRWYRAQLRQALLEVLAKWATKMRVTVLKWSIRRMKTKCVSGDRKSAPLNYRP